MIEICTTENCDRETPAGHDVCRRCAAIARGTDAPQNADRVAVSQVSQPHIGHRTPGASRIEWCYEHEMPAKYKRHPPQLEEPANPTDAHFADVTVSAAFFDAYIWRPDPDEARWKTKPEQAAAQLQLAREMSRVKNSTGETNQ